MLILVPQKYLKLRNISAGWGKTLSIIDLFEAKSTKTSTFGTKNKRYPNKETLIKKTITAQKAQILYYSLCGRLANPRFPADSPKIQ